MTTVYRRSCLKPHMGFKESGPLFSRSTERG